jgi:hypothetical protein
MHALPPCLNPVEGDCFTVFGPQDLAATQHKQQWQKAMAGETEWANGQKNIGVTAQHDSLRCTGH